MVVQHALQILLREASLSLALVICFRFSLRSPNSFNAHLQSSPLPRPCSLYLTLTGSVLPGLALACDQESLCIHLGLATYIHV